MLRLILLGVVATIIAACGGQSNVTPTGESAQGFIPSAGIQEVEYLDFTLAVTGAVTQTLTGTARTVDAGGQRMIAFAPPDYAYQAIVLIPRDAQPGEHTLGQDTALRAQFALGMGTEPNSLYMGNVNGTINLTSVEPFAGSFNYTVTNDAGQTATAQGSFTEVPLTVTLTANGAAIPPSEVYYSTSANDLTLAINGEENAVTVLFNFPPGAPAGEYPLIAYLSGGRGVEAIVTADGQDLPQIEGIITLTDGGVGAGERIGGSFTLTALSEDGEQTVTVAGTFANVPFMG